MTWIFVGSNSIPRHLTIEPNNFPLGSTVSRRGIELDSMKIKAMRDRPPQERVVTMLQDCFEKKWGATKRSCLF